ncbi:MAG TPA: hypothetical protein VFA96_06670 [Nocardioides sp.]|nr:hypothetical protein [Nocardioides sp.]
MDAATLDRMLTDLLLIDTSDALEAMAQQLASLHESLARDGTDAARLDSLGDALARLYWWSGRLLGGLSFANPDEQGVPDNGACNDVR